MLSKLEPIDELDDERSNSEFSSEKEKESEFASFSALD
jgi:hypothetical protein